MSTQIRDEGLSKASLHFRNKQESSKSVSYSFKSCYATNCLQLRKETEMLLREETVAETSDTNWNCCSSKPPSYCCMRSFPTLILKAVSARNAIKCKRKEQVSVQKSEEL